MNADDDDGSAGANGATTLFRPPASRGGTWNSIRRGPTTTAPLHPPCEKRRPPTGPRGGSRTTIRRREPPTKLWMAGGVCTMLASTIAIGLLGEGEIVASLMAPGLLALVFLANAMVLHPDSTRRGGCNLLLVLFVSAILGLPAEFLGIKLLERALLFLVNAIVLLCTQRRGCNAMLVVTYELTVLCLPAAIHSRNPFAMLPPSFVLFVYLSLSLPLECFKEKMSAMHFQSTDARPPSSGMLCVCDKFLTCAIWTQLVGAILIFVGSMIAAVAQFVETQKDMMKYHGHPSEDPGWGRGTPRWGEALQFISGVLFGIFATGSMVCIGAMVLHNLNPRSRREGGSNQNERENNERDGPGEQTGQGLEMIDGGAVSEGDGGDGLHAVTIV